MYVYSARTYIYIYIYIYIYVYVYIYIYIYILRSYQRRIFSCFLFLCCATAMKFCQHTPTTVFHFIFFSCTVLFLYVHTYSKMYHIYHIYLSIARGDPFLRGSICIDIYTHTHTHTHTHHRILFYLSLVRGVHLRTFFVVCRW